MAVSVNWGVHFLGALALRALLFCIYIRALDSWSLPFTFARSSGNQRAFVGFWHKLGPSRGYHMVNLGAYTCARMVLGHLGTIFSWLAVLLRRKTGPGLKGPRPKSFPGTRQRSPVGHVSVYAYWCACLKIFRHSHLFMSAYIYIYI